MPDPQLGATLAPYYMQRQPMTYAITANEMEHLSLLNTLTSAFAAASSAFLFFGLGVAANVWFQVGELTGAQDVMLKVVFPGSEVLAVFFFVLAALAGRKRSTELDTIRQESRVTGE